VDEDVAPTPSLEHDARRPAYVLWIAQVNDDIAVRAVEGDDCVIGCQPRDDRAADCTRAACHDGNTVFAPV
jgi:hypothetical protein